MRLPVRMLRFVATGVAGLVAPGLGTAAGVADSFFLDRWLKGHSPNLFMNQLKKLAEEHAD